MLALAQFQNNVQCALQFILTMNLGHRFTLQLLQSCSQCNTVVRPSNSMMTSTAIQHKNINTRFGESFGDSPGQPLHEIVYHM